MNKFKEIWAEQTVRVLPWDNTCAIHTHVYIPYWDELVLINFIDKDGKLMTENNVNYKIRRDYVKILSR